MKKLIVATIVAAVIGGVSQAAPKVTYEEHVLPVFRNACLRCHNPDKAKGDLDLSTFTALLNGGGSGIIVESGDSGASKLMKVVTHEEEPEMPPNGKLEDKEIAIIKQWIEVEPTSNTARGVIAVERKITNLLFLDPTPTSAN